MISLSSAFVWNKKWTFITWFDLAHLHPYVEFPIPNIAYNQLQGVISYEWSKDADYKF